MKKLLFIFLSALSLMTFAQKPKLAVYMTGDDPINEIVSDRLVDDFAHSKEYTVVERTASFLSALNKEHAYERTGEVDDKQIAALGQQFGVQFVCVTSVLDVWGSEKYITARIIDAETAEVVASCSSNGSIQTKSELINALNTLSNNFSEAVGSIKQNDAKKVAVYVTKTGNRDVDIVLGDQLVSGFAKSGKYIAIERTNVFLKKLKEEQGYQQFGAVADEDLIRWGQQSGVHYVCAAKAKPWGGDYWISTRMIDVITGDVVNSNKVEGRKLSNSQDVVKVAQEIATELSKGTLAEQEEEARIKAEKEARIRAEQERLRAEEAARQKAEEERIQREKQERLDNRKTELQKIVQQEYLVLTGSGDGQEYMVCTSPVLVSLDDIETHKTYSRYGFSDWYLLGWVEMSFKFNYALIPNKSLKVENRELPISTICFEIEHFLDIKLPIFRSGLEWWGYGDRAVTIVTGEWKYDCSINNLLYLDGSEMRRFIAKEAKISYRSEYEWRRQKTAYAFLVRKVK